MAVWGAVALYASTEGYVLGFVLAWGMAAVEGYALVESVRRASLGSYR